MAVVIEMSHASVRPDPPVTPESVKAAQQDAVRELIGPIAELLHQARAIHQGAMWPPFQMLTPIQKAVRRLEIERLVRDA